MKYIALLVSLFWTSLSFAGGAFTYHGISSGMTSDEVNAITGCKKQCSRLVFREVVKWLSENGDVPPNINEIFFNYTSRETGGKLWRIGLTFREEIGAIESAAQLRVLNELYPDAELQSFSDPNDNKDYLTALIIDSALFDADVEAIYQATISKY